MDHIETKILNSYTIQEAAQTWYSQQGLPNRGIPFKTWMILWLFIRNLLQIKP